MNDLVKISKKLSYLLRHDPKDLNIDKKGYVNTEDILNILNISFEDLSWIVENNDKKRFSFNEDQTKIKANQGHTINVELEFFNKKPPLVLYHGTPKRNVESILKNGLNKGKRHHVHLSDDYNKALEVAKRYCKNDVPVIFRISSSEMYFEGIKFFVSENDVWLVDFVDSKYLISYEVVNELHIS